MVVRYFDINIKRRLLGLEEIAQADALSIFNIWNKLFEQLNIPTKNIIGYASDITSVMFGHKSGISTLFKNINPQILILGCTCHLLHLCSSQAAEKLPSTVEQFIYDIYNHFAHSCKRKLNYKKSWDLWKSKHTSYCVRDKPGGCH